MTPELLGVLVGFALGMTAVVLGFHLGRRRQ